ncbi:protein tyrosine phosphatase [Actinophytocola sp. S1-96]|uniref:Protein tyrosine phosphatase n=2 Tax=Actinophytocola gossypii TaxID=2812003 RepID=A0ABT2JHI9_9PSEU|nr:protein tyrosine phosphatase [Actinophytocola gossypii]
MIHLPDGCRVRGRALRSPAPADPPDRALYLGRSHRDYRPDWPHEWLDWPDFRLPSDPPAAIRAVQLLHTHARSGEQVEVACGGGIGRTGTVIACLAVLSGVDPREAVAWTRRHYHRRAVETPWQRRWVTRFPTP